MSHPTRVRGLKFKDTTETIFLIWSHPTRVRGLKFDLTVENMIWSNVAPYTGAWIEICREMGMSLLGMRRTLHGCVD